MNFDYYSFTGRNIGFIDEREQQLLRQARVFVCGVGGMGGAAFMALARAGVAGPRSKSRAMPSLPALMRPLVRRAVVQLTSGQ
jgi:molybdopterin/thiamine biosynthesis adenylyltransferase